MQTRRETAWKKSRKFGDVKGGRTHPKIPDKIFARAHSVPRPATGTDRPIFIRDNPSRDYFFPITEDEVRRELAHLPRRDWKEITHVWLRRMDASKHQAGKLPLAEYCRGSGVCLVTLYPWPRSMEWDHGAKKPSAREQKVLARHGAELVRKGESWISRWEIAGLKNFYVEYLLFHEIGHHVDWPGRHWSKANRRAVEEFADQYALGKTARRSITFKAEPVEANRSGE